MIKILLQNDPHHHLRLHRDVLLRHGPRDATRQSAGRNLVVIEITETACIAEVYPS